MSQTPLVQWGYPVPTSSPPYLQAPNSSRHTTHSDSIGSDVIQKLMEATLGRGKRTRIVSSCLPLSLSTRRPLKQPQPSMLAHTWTVLFSAFSSVQGSVVVPLTSSKQQYGGKTWFSLR